ncbi:hypothetical protein CBS63078_3420 [Aspergillus niger]|nr:hypothetical protein CBS115989_9111 [Aspergillus niger]KAI2829548.1 hypothetical protein CBS133816_4272 [Aspergillus niger]KAI2843573.1 hypothetical protein CBS11232_8228 [Aspergillus niger]KAI2871008.1 hypothetical protein CBS115988_8885 [Aspergillus niger]KAI2905692.1 hypothetical protein CBS11852_1226 [Aspergillus niger]
MNVDISLHLVPRRTFTRDLLPKRPSQLHPMDILNGRLIHHKARHHSRCSTRPRCRFNKPPQDVCNRAIKRRGKRNVAQVFFRPLHVVAVLICCYD